MSGDWIDGLALDEDSPKLDGKHTPSAALGGVTVAQAEKVTSRGKRGKGKKDARFHGQYRQITLRLRPEVVRDIEEWAARLDVDRTALQRFLVWRGLQALAEGERPELSQRPAMKEY